VLFGKCLSPARSSTSYRANSKFAKPNSLQRQPIAACGHGAAQRRGGSSRRSCPRRVSSAFRRVQRVFAIRSASRLSRATYRRTSCSVGSATHPCAPPQFMPMSAARRSGSSPRACGEERARWPKFFLLCYTIYVYDMKSSNCQFDPSLRLVLRLGHMAETTLTETFRSLLWSYGFSRIDPVKHKSTIVLQTINYGTLAQWRWLVQNYGHEGVREARSTIPASAIRPRARQLAALMFGIG